MFHFCLIILIGIEDKEHYALASLLDAKYKGYFFRDPAALERAKSKLIEKLVEAMSNETEAEVKSYLFNYSRLPIRTSKQFS